MSVRIVSTPDTLGGKKRIAGTRISVDLIYNYVRANKINQIKKDYPHLTREQIDAARRYVARHPEEFGLGLTAQTAR